MPPNKVATKSTAVTSKTKDAVTTAKAPSAQAQPSTQTTPTTTNPMSVSKKIVASKPSTVTKVSKTIVKASLSSATKVTPSNPGKVTRAAVKPTIASQSTASNIPSKTPTQTPPAVISKPKSTLSTKTMIKLASTTKPKPSTQALKTISKTTTSDSTTTPTSETTQPTSEIMQPNIETAKPAVSPSKVGSTKELEQNSNPKPTSIASLKKPLELDEPGKDGESVKKLKTSSTIILTKTKELSASELLAMRAEKFKSNITNETKLTMRAARFGIAGPTNPNQSISSNEVNKINNSSHVDPDLLAKRAARFGSVTNPTALLKNK